MTDDDRFERELAAVIRAGAPDLAPAALRIRVEGSIQVAATRRQTRRAPFFAAAAAAIVLLVAAAVGAPWLGSRHPIATQTGGASQTDGGIRSAGTSPLSATAVPILPEPITDPGQVQIGDLLSATDGWVFNTDGHLFLTHSGGATWREITPPGVDSSREFVPSFVDLEHGWVAQLDRDGGTDLRVWRTKDAGQTWEESDIPGAALVLGGLAFLDPSIGYLVTDPGGQHPKPELRWTNDGGATWSEPIDLATVTGIPTVGEVHFFDQRDGIMASANAFLRTSDGGRTWVAPRALDPGVIPAIGSSTPRYAAVNIVDENTAFVVVEVLDNDGKETGRSIIETRDAGATWKTALTDRLHRSWAFVDALDWIGTDGEQVWATDDGGVTFESTPSTGLPVVLDFAAMDFVDPQHGWAEASGGVPCKGFGCLRIFQLFRTDDGGQSWSLVGACEAGSTLSFACPSLRPT